MKAVLLAETPWVLEAKNETERKKRIALLFDLNRMANEQKASLEKLQQLQTPNGGWSWFEGMPDNRYITQLIVTGFGKLHHLQVIELQQGTGPDQYGPAGILITLTSGSGRIMSIFRSIIRIR